MTRNIECLVDSRSYSRCWNGFSQDLCTSTQYKWMWALPSGGSRSALQPLFRLSSTVYLFKHTFFPKGNTLRYLVWLNQSSLQDLQRQQPIYERIIGGTHRFTRLFTAGSVIIIDEHVKSFLFWLLWWANMQEESCKSAASILALSSIVLNFWILCCQKSGKI
jgi:hypothetical protein